VQVHDSPSGRGARVLLKGELDIALADRLRLTMLQACVDRDLVLVDMQDVTFIDSTVIGVLVAAWKRCGLTGGRLFLTGVHGEPLRTLELVGLTSLLLADQDVPTGLEDEFRTLLDAPTG
jgi:anti-sigma B factor antagonist